MKLNKRHYTEIDIISSILLIICGVLLAVIPFTEFVNILFILLGIFIIATNIPSCIAFFMASADDNRYLPSAIAALISIICGILFIFYHGIVITFILAAWLIIFPIIRIILEKANWKERLKKDLPLIIIGVLLFFTPFADLINIIVKVFGGIIAVYGLVVLILAIVHLRKNKDDDDFNSNGFNNKPKDYIDVDVKEVK